jgi:endonuclease/exonuclease/phosphatase (EEP) superfamily protein YafD
VRALVVLLGMLFLTTHFGELHFMLDNLSNFTVHFAVVFLISAVVLAIGRNFRWAIVSAMGVALCLAPVVPWYFSEPELPPHRSAAIVKLLLSNVRLHNKQHARLIDLINDEQPDVIALVEVNSRWLQKLRSLHAVFPYRFEMPDKDYAGLALYSKVPLKDARILRLGQFATPAIAATMELSDGEVRFILAHPPPPLNADLVKRRNAQLRALARYIDALERPVVLAGDLNVTMWNGNYRSFAEKAGLQNARAGIGIAPTWPAVQVLGVPIDHILATAPVRLRNFRVLPGIGSDHLPISADFLLDDREHTSVRINPPGP